MLSCLSRWMVYVSWINFPFSFSVLNQPFLYNQPIRTTSGFFSGKLYSRRNNLFLILMDTPLPNRILVGKRQGKLFWNVLLVVIPRVVSRYFFGENVARLWKTIGNQSCRWRGILFLSHCSFLLSFAIYWIKMIDEMKGICQKAKLIERIVHLWNAEMKKRIERVCWT